MNTNTIPKGWVRAQAITVNTVPSPYITEPGVIAAVQPYHKTAPGADPLLTFTSVADYEAWRKWWFDAPADPKLNFSWQESKPVPAPVKANFTGPFDMPVPPGFNPFDKPKPVVNPFDKPPKPFNPFDDK